MTHTHLHSNTTDLSAIVLDIYGEFFIARESGQTHVLASHRNCRFGMDIIQNNPTVLKASFLIGQSTAFRLLLDQYTQKAL